jgi:DNA processing protein
MMIERQTGGSTTTAGVTPRGGGVAERTTVVSEASLSIERVFVSVAPNTRRETAAIVALLRSRAVAWNRAAEAVEEVGSAVELLAGLRGDALFDERADLDATLDAIEQELDAWETEGMRVVSVLDASYPVNLRAVHDRPALLFVRGRLDDADESSVAIVGTRQAGEAGRAWARSCAHALVEAGYVIVSGLAAGIDTAAHKAALEADGRTVAVIGTGLRRVYPKANARLQELLGREHAVVSQFWPDQPPGKHTFPMRNGVMSGFALATVVVEASDTSGARTQARLALQHRRPVFLLSSLLEHAWAREYAARAGTHVIDAPSQVIGELERLYSLDAALTR